MADTAVSLVIDYLVPLLNEEVNILSSVHQELESIKVELEFIKPYLKDADERAERGETNDAMKALVKQVRKVSFRIEDVIDDYILHQLDDQHHGLIGCLKEIFQCIINCKPRHEIATEIQEINTTLGVIDKLRSRYGLQVIEEGSSSSNNNNVKNESTWHDPRVASLFLEEDEVVGIEIPRAELSTLMAQEASLKRTVISVVGEGGLGKTTLVKKVYDDQIASKKFTCHAWITVSQSYNKKELLKTIMKELCETESNRIEAMDEASLIGKARRYLQQQRYVIIFDDVWDIHFWDFIKDALPNCSNGSRVIITTRNNDVAIFSKKSEFDKIYELKGLPHHKAWDLFCKKAFQFDCPIELKKVSHGIVKKCNGVPLAIVTIGSLLSTKDKKALEWKKFYDRLGSELKSNPGLENVKKIILLSYIDLPYHLRACFLYFGIFLEDYSIRRGKLVRLWIAEGFVKEEGGKTLEEIAEEYLKDLIHRSLVQMVVQDRWDYKVHQKVRPCGVHDIMREIILSKYEDLILLKKDVSISDDGQFRCLSIHNGTEDNVMNRITKSRIRSVITFARDELSESFMGKLMTKFKLLKVLDFEDASQVNSLPEEVGNLLHLRYLSLRKTNVKVLPKSIGRLHYLLTLDLKESLVDVLPIEINKLHKLRHLLACNRTNKFRGVMIQEGFGCLKDLQELKSVEANDDGGSLVKELIMLRQLKKLGIQNLKREDGKDLCIAVENMSHLESLRIEATQNDILDIQQISSPPDSLQRLVLIGHLEKFPDWILEHQNLVSIRLKDSRLTEDPLKFLQTLPSLLKLELDNAYDVKVLHFEGGGFQKLERLDLIGMTQLLSLKADTGALPLLKFAKILQCPALKEVADQIEKVRVRRGEEEKIRVALFLQKAALLFI